MIPPEHQRLRRATRCASSAYRRCPRARAGDGVLGWLHSVARSHVDVALAHRPVLIANALGSPPVDVIEQAHEHGVQGRRAGRRAPSTRCRHVANGVDIIVAQGYEAGGHTGEIASMVLTPEIVDAVGPDVPVLGAGGIGSRPPDRGRPRARRARACGPGSVWLTTEEYQHLDAATPADRGVRSRPPRADTVRDRGSTPASRPGCSRRTWTEAWARGGRPRAAADAAAEPAGRRGAQPDERARATRT